ncbi:putative quinol monooxygenase [Arenibacter sp. M-2]|uniref:putative quinol monooxygenase n=1 Tax=Arenibacter sp. M-2 TaxID=3053612 RepID=UPI0025703266|nr:putative quinol monooxygenase [Arenibacter sp. M-2]MDL5510524.1 putative quinol monooxygenase [Arenibacter sp. M-2]|tara:strand:- start:916 stop:1335 length:420 start_codon:yes stop_codon:yes gene_type:complete
MGFPKISLLFLLMFLSINSYSQESNPDSTQSKMMVRIAAIEIDSSYINEYIAILKEEAEASVRLEPGVICIYPMFQKEHPTQIRLLEVYANKEAYESHLQTPHFKHYKEATLKMVKDLKLIDMNAIDTESMPDIFRKLN